MKLILDTVMLFVQDVDRLKDFYVNKLGLEIAEEIKSEWVLLKAGGCNIALHKAGADYQSAGPDFKVNGNVKIVFQTDDNIFDQRERLHNEGITISAVKTFDNYDYRLCDGEDPEGNVFQLKQKKNVQ